MRSESPLGREKKPVTIQEMRALEDEAERLGISKLLLMENAGSAIASYIFEKFLMKGEGRTRIAIVAGTGNNGGDAFVTARHLAYWKELCQLEVFLIGKTEDIRAKEARSNWEILVNLNSIEKTIIDSSKDIVTFRDRMDSFKVAVVGIFGTGFRGKPRDLQFDIIRELNAKKNIFKISVDIPSGMEAETGESAFAVESDVTITMHAPKVGMTGGRPETQKKCGEIIVANIGLPL